MLAGIAEVATLAAPQPPDGMDWVACGVPILDQARDLGLVRDLPGDGFLKMNAFKFVTVVPERVQVDRADQSR